MARHGNPKIPAAARPQDFRLPWVNSRALTALFGCGLLSLLVLWTFWPALGNQFVYYDDDVYVAQNPYVQSGLTWQSVAWAFRSTHASSNWHPLTWLSHMLDCQIFKLNPWGHHLSSILLHSANTLLVFLVLRLLTSANGKSLLVAAFFGLHPLRVESVAWVAERKDVLSTFFGLLALLAYARYAQFKAPSPNPRVPPPGNLRHAPRFTSHAPPVKRHPSRYYTLSLFLFALGLMSKPMLVTFPFLLLLLDFWPLGRLSGSLIRPSSHPPALQSPNTLILPLIFEKLPFFLLAAASSLITLAVQDRAHVVWAQVPFIHRIGNALVSYCRYIGKLLYPTQLSVFYPHPGSWPLLQVLLAAVLFGVLSLVVLRFRRSRPWLVVGWFWFVGALVPVIGLVQVGAQAMADRYTYLPCLGLVLLLVWLADELFVRWRFRFPIGLLVASALLLLCAGLARHHLAFWHDGETLFQHTAALEPNDPVVQNLLGVALDRQGQTGEAMMHFRRALSLRFDFPNAQYNLATALSRTGHLQEAVLEFQQALRLQPAYLDARQGLGVTLYGLGRFQDAIQQYQEVLQMDPDRIDAHKNLGSALFRLNRFDEAATEYRLALQRAPDSAENHNNLGSLLAATGRVNDAIAEFEKTLSLDPTSISAHINLADCFDQKGLPADAAAHLEEALRLDSHLYDVHYRLGLLLLKHGRRDEAFAHFNEAVRLKPDFRDALQQLSALATP